MKLRTGGRAAISERSCVACRQADHGRCWRYQATEREDCLWAWDLQDNAPLGVLSYPWCSCYEYKHEQLYPQYFYDSVD